MRLTKKILCLVLAAAILLCSLAACGKNNSPEKTTKGASVTEGEKASNAAWLGNHYVGLAGAELATNYNDETVVRIYLNYTNNSDKTGTIFHFVDDTITQKGETVDMETGDYDIPAIELCEQDIRPGASLCVAMEYLCDPEGGEVTCTYVADEKTLTFTLDPANLPGAPVDYFKPEAVEDPQWLNGLPTEGSFRYGKYYASVDRCERTELWLTDEEGIRIYFEFTNNSDEETAAWSELFGVVEAFQDGVSLPEANAADEVPEDENYETDILPGETISCSMVFALRSDSPVEFEINGDDGNFGTVFYLD